tara:strand:+ start:3954 stop:4652 length:699 start_codon:yes stop_codon:yes gene_type:complete
MKKILSLVVASTFWFSSSAMSEINVGLSYSHAGFYAVATEIFTENDSTTQNKTSEAGAFEDSFESIFIEYDLGTVVVGLNHNLNAIETPENVNLQSNDGEPGGNNSYSLTNKVSAKFDNMTTLYAIIPTDFFGLYFKAGYVMADVKTEESLATGGQYPDVDTDGITAGFGFQYDQDSFFVRVEAMASEYDEVEATNSSLQNFQSKGNEPVAKKITVNDMMSANATVSVGYSF